MRRAQHLGGGEGDAAFAGFGSGFIGLGGGFAGAEEFELLLDLLAGVVLTEEVVGVEDAGGDAAILQEGFLVGAFG